MSETVNETINVVETDKKLTQTEIVVVLDRSGSMASIADATVEGFNTFLSEQQNAEGEAFITLVQFDDRYEMNYKSIPVKDAQPLINRETFVPRGSTALYDAIGKTLNELNTDRDVVFVIITDGYENASREFRGDAIKKMIETVEKDKGWKFIYMGANQDAVKTGSMFGMKAANSVTYAADSEHTKVGFMNISDNLTNYRMAKTSFAKTASFDGLSNEDMEMLSQNLGFSDEQRKKSS